MTNELSGQVTRTIKLFGNIRVPVGGISYYEDLPDKPKINGVELTGNKTSQDLGIVSSNQYATSQEAGIVKVGENLKIDEGVLSVETTNDAEQDNTKPMTSAGVYVELGNINILLSKI